jgi:hypothetical protein
MNPSTLQRWIDELHRTSRQQWLLRLGTVLSPVAALLAATAAAGTWWPFGLVVVTVLATTSALQPDSHTALVVIAVVATHWLVTVDQIDTPWLPVASVCLLVFHAVNALAATFPTGGEVPIATLAQWLGRTMLGAAVTVWMWILVVVLAGRHAPGNGLLTALALAIVAGAAIIIRARSMGGTE